MPAMRFPAAALLAAGLMIPACSDSEEPAEPEVPAVPESAADLPAPPPVGAPSAETGGDIEPVDACTLLNAADVGRVIGHGMDGPEAGPVAGGGVGEGKMSTCSFASRSGAQNAAPAELLAELGSTWFVTVTVWVWPSADEGARNYMDGMREMPLGDDPVQSIDGVADEAVWNGTLHARAGAVTVSLDVRPPRDAEAPQELEKERALMEAALEAL